MNWIREHKGLKGMTKQEVILSLTICLIISRQENNFYMTCATVTLDLTGCSYELKRSGQKANNTFFSALVGEGIPQQGQWAKPSEILNFISYPCLIKMPQNFSKLFKML